MITNLYLSFKVHFLSFIRNKNAFFWATTFPIFLYLVFYTIFNSFSAEGYALFLLIGVLGMTLTADGLFGVGAVIQQNYRNGTIRLLKKMPINILIYFVGMIINRSLIIISLLLFLNICSYFVAGEFMTFSQVPQVFLGIFIGMWTFSFLGLSLTFLNIKSGSEKGIKNLAYFLILFSSNALYEIKFLNPEVEKFANFLPLNDILHILRGEPAQWIGVACWMLIPMIVFYYLFNKVKYSR